MIEDFKDWLHDRKSFDYIVHGSLIRAAAFCFILMCFIIGGVIGFAILFTTAPLWIIPYLVKEGRR